MITNVSTTVTPLKPRPETRGEAHDLILSMAHGAVLLNDDDATDQCARILGVCLWHDINSVTFSDLVDALALAGRLRLGDELPSLSIGSAEERTGWIDYYETQAQCHINELLYSAGYAGAGR